MELPESSGPKTEPRFWCLECCRNASDKCKEQHGLWRFRRPVVDLDRGQQADHGQQVRLRLDALTTGATALRDLLRALKNADDALKSEMESGQSRLAERRDAVLQAGLRLHAAVEQGKDDAIEEAMKTSEEVVAGLGELVSDAELVLPALTAPASRLCVALQESPHVWWADLAPRQSALARLLACRLLASGDLRLHDADVAQHVHDARRLAAINQGSKSELF